MILAPFFMYLFLDTTLGFANHEGSVKNRLEAGALKDPDLPSGRFFDIAVKFGRGLEHASEAF